MPDFASAISAIESGGNYSILGPETKGDRAYGKYQVMGQNIPQWSKDILGVELTPRQFLENPQAQDAIFQGKFGQYVEKYGPEGASKAWFAGERGMNNPNAKDILGTTVASYGQKFMKGLGQEPQAPIQATPQPTGIAAPSPTAPQMPAGAVSPNSMPAYGWSPNNAPGDSPQPQSQMADMPLMPPLGGPKPPDLFRQLQAFMQRTPPRAGFRFSRTS